MPAMSQVNCVYCRKRPVDDRWRPFCSERCKRLDLAAWAGDSYRIAGDPVEDPPAAAELADDGEG